MSKNPGAEVRPGAYLAAPPPMPPGPLPERIVLEAPATGVAGAVFEEVEGQARRPLWKILVLPGAGRVEVPTAQPGVLTSKPAQVSHLTLDFGAGFDADRVDGVRVWERLARFARTQSDLH
ncbi:MAG: hypothetical protein IT285_08860 [Bdellovibrionales bacterium]|nr:hypothetical protein [Bdellovibrionales bacterium]